MTEKKGRQILGVDLGPLKADVAKLAQAAGQLPSAWAREVLQAAVAAGGASPRPAQPPLRSPRRRVDGETVRFDMRLRLPADVQLRSAAHAAGLSRSEYVERLILSPTSTVVGPKTLEQLAKSNVQLQRLGVNLNQLMRHLNDKPGQLTSSDRQLLRTVATVTEEHIKAAARFMAAYSPTRRTGSGARRPKKGT